MRIETRWLGLTLLGVMLSQSGFADEAPMGSSSASSAQQQKEDLNSLLERVVGSPRKQFLVAEYVSPHVVTGPLEKGPIPYALFLTILRDNGLAVVVSDKAVSVINEANVRQYAMPTIISLDEKYPDDQWVTYLLRVKTISAAQLVPVLRPLLPQNAQMASAGEQNTLLIVDRYANIRRAVEIVGALDKPGSSDKQPAKQP